MGKLQDSIPEDSKFRNKVFLLVEKMFKLFLQLFGIFGICKQTFLTSRLCVSNIPKNIGAQ